MTKPNNSFKNLISFFAIAVLLSMTSIIVIPIEKAHSATSLAVIPNNSNKTTRLAIEAGPFYEAKVGKITGQRVVGSTNGGSPQIEQSIIENGTIKGVGNVTNLQTWTNTLRSPKIYYGIGQGIITTADGQDMATWSGYDIGRSTIAGVITYHGITFFNTNSTGKLAFLKNLEGLHITQVDGNKQVTKIWEWPAANSTKAAGNATTAANSSSIVANLSKSKAASNVPKTAAANSTKAASSTKAATTAAATNNKGSILDPITRLGQSIASGLKGLGNLITGNKK